MGNYTVSEIILDITMLVVMVLISVWAFG